ncbi:unnamed protein product [Mycena citricolor]|uniref:U4/U6.U5 small nuclear ribonucleoprotein 27kDa protein domain-containing protein n=1 Tax=Mycena citricolor TaxID=2018698 RepID=A0AAD2HMD3_9AGAR|nr:unnamed protein product [Mycena citricolor]
MPDHPRRDRSRERDERRERDRERERERDRDRDRDRERRPPDEPGRTIVMNPDAAQVVRAVHEDAMNRTTADQTAEKRDMTIEEMVPVAERTRATMMIVLIPEEKPNRAILGHGALAPFETRNELLLHPLILVSPPSKRPNLDPDAPDDPMLDGEEGEEMDDDAGMMAMMGMAGFGSTKGKHIEGNQEGAVNIKKQRTWRQYMNRRGGFNRPLDKIK